MVFLFPFLLQYSKACIFNIFTTNYDEKMLNLKK